MLREMKTTAGEGDAEMRTLKANIRVVKNASEYASAGGQEPDDQAKLLNGLGLDVQDQGRDQN